MIGRAKKENRGCSSSPLSARIKVRMCRSSRHNCERSSVKDVLLYTSTFRPRTLSVAAKFNDVGPLGEFDCSIRARSLTLIASRMLLVIFTEDVHILCCKLLTTRVLQINWSVKVWYWMRSIWIIIHLSIYISSSIYWIHFNTLFFFFFFWSSEY